MRTFQPIVKTPLLLFSFLTIAHGKDDLAHVDLAKLHHPATALEIIKPLILPDEEWQLTGYVLLKAPQRDGKPPLHVLCAARDYISSYKSSDEYESEDDSALFGKQEESVFSRTEPSLVPIRDSGLFVFDENGDEIRPFGGNNYIDEGYVCDFDRDGILDRADSTNYGLDEAPKHNIQGFDLESVEPNPRSLLRVIYNWHPDSADDANDWTFVCFDKNDDGFPEIAFGPLDENGKIRPEIVFEWDAETNSYSAGKLPEKAHVHVMREGETLKSIAANGGLGYPLVKDIGTFPSVVDKRRDYVFKSLADRPIDEIAAFFNGTARRDHFDGAVGSFPDTLPENFLSMQPKKAAMALAEANRNPTHREQYRLAVDDLNGATPPPAGWADYNWVSSGCYSLSSESYVVRFGTPDPVLIAYGYNSIGVVGRNPYADQPANSARLIKLSEEQATFLAETTYWLDRIRSKRLVPDDGSYGGSGSTADGFGSFNLYPENGAPREIASGTDWATSSISGCWTREYDRTVFINLTGLLFRKCIPQMLGDRWENGTGIEKQSLTTPTEDRLADRVGDQAREKLAEDFSSILELHSDSPLPPEVIARLCSAAGDEALVSLLPDLKKLHTSLPAPGKEDREFEKLRKRFARDHFGDFLEDQPDEHKNAYARYNELLEKRKFDFSAVVREELESAIGKLRLASDSAQLKQEIIDEGPNAQWALSLLRRNEPDTWAILVSANFSKADKEGKRTIFSILAAGHPPAAAQLLANLDAGEIQALILEIASYRQKHAAQDFPESIPPLIALAADRKVDIYRRGAAMETLSEAKLTDPQLRELTEILIAEIRDPEKSEYGSSTLGSALEALVALPDPAQHLDLISNLADLPGNAFPEGFRALEAMTRHNPARERILSDFLRTQFVQSHGMMNDHFAMALIYDIRILTPEIAKFASEKPDQEDGDGANYSGGNFKSPIGSRYHIAREITALWSENDPATLAKMWIAFVSAHPSYFDPERETGPARELAEKHIRVLPTAECRIAMHEIFTEFPRSEYYPATREWLRTIEK